MVTPTTQPDQPRADGPDPLYLVVGEAVYNNKFLHASDLRARQIEHNQTARQAPSNQDFSVSFSARKRNKFLLVYDLASRYKEP